MNTSTTFDVIVIGAGPGGYVAAIRCAQLGLNTAIIEKEHMGGICLNWGCIPTKAMLRSAEVFHLMQRATEFGLQADAVKYDLDAVVKRSRNVAAGLNNGVKHLMKKHNVNTIMGTARLSAKDSVIIEDNNGKQHQLIGKNIIIATGAHARQLPGLESDGNRVWTYKDALMPKHMPKHLLVIGSGAIGIEFASFYNTLGANTTIVEVQNRILPVEDSEISAFAKKCFVKQGMTILESALVKNLNRQQNKITADIEHNGTAQAYEFDTVIAAVGIVGNTQGIGLDHVGINIEKGHIVTDAYGRTGIPNIYAIGDVTGAPWLAHKASHEAIMVAEVISGKNPNQIHPITPLEIAGCTYCYPQIASVGYSESAAKAAGYTVKVGRFPFIGNGKAIALGETEGMIKTIFDANTGELLGAHMIGAEVTELIQGYVVGRTLETTEAELISTVFPHPTLSEMMHESTLAAFGRAIHI